LPAISLRSLILAISVAAIRVLGDLIPDDPILGGLQYLIVNETEFRQSVADPAGCAGQSAEAWKWLAVSYSERLRRGKGKAPRQCNAPH